MEKCLIPPARLERRQREAAVPLARLVIGGRIRRESPAPRASRVDRARWLTTRNVRLQEHACVRCAQYRSTPHVLTLAAGQHDHDVAALVCDWCGTIAAIS